MIKTFRSVVQFDRITLDPVDRRLKKCVSVEDMRRVAKRRLPRGVFDYIDGGAENERSVERNVAAFEHVFDAFWSRFQAGGFDGPEQVR